MSKKIEALEVTDLNDIPEYFTGAVILVGKALLYFKLGMLHETKTRTFAYMFNDDGEEAYLSWLKSYNKRMATRNN